MHGWLKNNVMIFVVNLCCGTQTLLGIVKHKYNKTIAESIIQLIESTQTKLSGLYKQNSRLEEPMKVLHCLLVQPFSSNVFQLTVN